MLKESKLNDLSQTYLCLMGKKIRVGDLLTLSIVMYMEQ